MRAQAGIGAALVVPALGSILWHTLHGAARIRQLIQACSLHKGAVAHAVCVTALAEGAGAQDLDVAAVGLLLQHSALSIGQTLKQVLQNVARAPTKLAPTVQDSQDVMDQVPDAQTASLLSPPGISM